MRSDLIIATDGKNILLHHLSGRFSIPKRDDVEILSLSRSFSCCGCLVLPLSDVKAISGNVGVHPLRQALAMMDADGYARIARGAALLNWDREERYCRRDAHPLLRNSEISKVCGKCGCEYFPSLVPAIVVLVTRGEEALLVRAKSFTNPVYALVAGFVENGETLEECVRREVREETSLEIDDIRYIGSQSWPFPHQLMTGFTARYVSGEIKFVDHELADGAFFRRDALPPLPSPPSLSRHIIDLWLHAQSNTFTLPV